MLSGCEVIGIMMCTLCACRIVCTYQWFPFNEHPPLPLETPLRERVTAALSSHDLDRTHW